MSKLRRKPKIARDEKGQILVFVLVVMIFGMLVIAPLLAYVDVSMKLGRMTEENAYAYSAADAGVAWVLANLLQSQDDPEQYFISNETLTFNDYQVKVSCNATTGAPEPFDPTHLYVYLDPYDTEHGATFEGVDPFALGPGQFWSFAFYAVAGTNVVVNWAFTPEGCPSLLELYSGTTPSGDPLTVNPTGVLQYPDALQGWYTLVFRNGSTDGVTIESKPYFSGNDQFTWVQVQGYQDYIITSTAGGVTITAYVRQTPGPSKYWQPQEVSILSWQVD